MGTTTREQIIAIEQKAVDRAYDCYAARLAELTNNSLALASASGKDSVANRIDGERRAEEYGGLGNESLVISRVDAREKPGDEPETWYIGRRTVHDTATSDPVVLAWTNPLAKKWTEALPTAPGEVVLRRQLRCAQRIVEDYFDEIAVTIPAQRPAAEAVGKPTAETASPTLVPRQRGRAPARTPADIASLQRKKAVQPDDFLLRELQRSRRGSMRDIVETIRRDQMALVTGSPSDILIVQGGPGTGKSAVGLHRVTWLIHNNHFTAPDVLVIGPHQRFLDYVGQVLPTLGVRNVNAVQLTRLWDGEILGEDPLQARMVKSDDRMAAVLRRRVENECRPEALDDLTTAPSYEGGEPELTVTAGRTTLRIPRSELHALLDEVRGGSGAYRARRERFRSLLVDRLLQQLIAVAPRRSRDTMIRRDLERNRQVERLIERLWPSPSARETLRNLYDSPDALRACADGILTDEEQAILHRPRAATAAAEPWTLDDHVCLEELQYLITGETPPRYGHIVIDEAQDLTPMQARSLRRRCQANGSMTVLGDLAQATGPHAHTDWDRLGTLLSDHGDWRVEQLSTSYRVPAEIMEFVLPLARTVAPTLPYPQAVREAGENAVRSISTEPWKLLDDTVAQATRLIGTSDGHTLRSVAVIVPDDSGWLDEIRRHLDQAPGVTAQGREAVSVLAAAHAKGMEYDHVLVVEPATIADRGPAGLRQLYIALTRSTQTLTVLHTSPLPTALTTSGDAEQPHGPQPQPADRDVPEIGTTIRFRVIGHTTGGNYKVEAISPTTNRPLLLAVRHGSTHPTAGAELDGWVLRHASNLTFVTLDEHGRKPISPNMAKRYATALAVIGELVNGDLPGDARARLSELKGMANRCLRLDQPDWLDVWKVLGSPDKARLNLLRDLATNTIRALTSTSLTPSWLQTEVERSGWADALTAARQTLEQRLADTSDTVAQSPDSPAAPQRSEPKDPASMSATATAPAEPSTGLLHTLETSAAADRTCKTHEAVRHELMAALLRADAQPDSSPVIDVHCATPHGHFLYEVLGSGRSTHTDLRSGAARLLEINHTLPTPADHLYLVLSEPPSDNWSAAALHEVFDVHLLWRTSAGWDGPDTGTALGSSQA